MQMYTHLQCLDNHIDDISNGILGPAPVTIFHAVPNQWTDREDDVLKLCFSPKRYNMIFNQEAASGFR